MAMRYFHLIALAAFATTAPAADWKPTPIPGVDMKCFTESTPVEWSFCVNSVASSASHDVIYHFHGRNGAADWWNDQTYYTGKVHARWLATRVDPPTVVTVSFGKLWLLTERPDEETGGLFRVFIDHVMRRVEREISHPVANRSLVGESMGGMNALMVALKTGDTFSRTAALCAPLQAISPYSSLGEMYRYFQSSSMSIKRLFMLLIFSRKFYPSEESWKQNDPLEISKRYRQPAGVSLYVTCGAKDDWGCMEGSESLVKNVRDRGGRVDWYPRLGGHCDIDVDSLADFLVR